MADNAVPKQLPIMVRKTKSRFPVLAGKGMYQKMIAGDGNCLFASFSDQLYNSPAKHAEIRHGVVEFMRAHREDFEPYMTLDDLEQRRETRKSTTRARKDTVKENDPWEVYLQRMSGNAVYGGHLEIDAFSRAYDKDVIIYWPMEMAEAETKISNKDRAAGKAAQTVHVAFTGESQRAGHYDSVRTIVHVDPSPPARSPTRSIESEPTHIQVLQRVLPTVAPEDIQKFLEKGKKDLDASFQQLLFGNRARSSSRSSSQSTSSKRSRDDDRDKHRVRKNTHPSLRARTRKRDQDRNRVVALVSSMEEGTEISFRIRVESPAPEIPASNPGTESPVSSSSPPPPTAGNKDTPGSSPSSSSGFPDQNEDDQEGSPGTYA